MLGDRRIVLCLGPGGVGKTTVAAAVGLALARTGEQVAVLTIDPARRLADAIGRRGELANTPTLVVEPDAERAVAGPANRLIGGQLWAAMLDPGETFRHIVETEATDAGQAERILSNRLFRNLTTTLSGTNEYMAAERLHQLHSEGRFDRIVVDTPPSHHVLDFLDGPGRLTRFIDHRLYRSVLGPQPGWLRPLNAWAKAVMRLLGGLVGSSVVDDVVGFFADFEGLDQGFRRRAAEIETLLTGPDTAYVLITTPRPDRLTEADWILDNLEGRGRRADALIVNRILPFDRPSTASPGSGPTTDDPDVGRGPEHLPDPVLENLAQLETLAEQQAALVEPLIDRLLANRSIDEAAVIRLAERLIPVHDLDGLGALADGLVAPLTGDRRQGVENQTIDDQTAGDQAGGSPP